jgi:hypothetical protein
MRLPEAKIRKALVHPDKLVRQEALLYFADCYSRDAEVMHLAIKCPPRRYSGAALVRNRFRNSPFERLRHPDSPAASPSTCHPTVHSVSIHLTPSARERLPPG